MDLFITSENGNLVQNGDVIKPPLFKPKGKYVDGDLFTMASLQHIQSVSESLLEFFVRPQGMKLQSENVNPIAVSYTHLTLPTKA